MIKLTYVHWHTGEVKGPVFINPDQLVWMERTTKTGVNILEGSPVKGDPVECTQLCLVNYSLHVTETPEEVTAMISAWRNR